ncbi:uncharacterized protein LOC142915697 [Petromyzon marinus]|uniref:uncharacterized protein LOC142915697 n=1 Tax=Petromyzon marinus TaxID=7757 RepID=UPI003F6EDDA0
MCTYYFAADSLEEMRVWMKAMAQASQLQMEIPQGNGGGGGGGNRSRGRAAAEEEAGGQVLVDGLRGAPGDVAAPARWRPPRSDDDDERGGGPRGDVEIVTEEGPARSRAGTDDDDDAAAAAVAAEELRRQLRDGDGERGAAAERRDGDERFDPSAGPGRTTAEAADRPTAGAAILRPEAAANTDRMGLAGSSSSSSSLSAFNQDEFGYGAADGAGEGHRAAAALERQTRDSTVQLEQWMMRSLKEKNDIASTQTLPRSMPSYRQSLVVVGAPGGVDVAAAAPGARRQRAAEFSHGHGARCTQTLDRRPTPSMVHTSTPQSTPQSTPPSLQGRTVRHTPLTPTLTLAAHPHAHPPHSPSLLTPSLAPPLHLQRNLRLIESQACIESSLEVLHLQIAQRRSHEQQQQQRLLLQADLVHLRADGARLSRERPKSAMDALYPAGGPAGGAARGKMTAEEQLERLKLNQKAAAAAGSGVGGDAATTVTPGGSGRCGHAMTLDRRTVLAARSPTRPASVDVSRLTKLRQRQDDLDIAEMERAVQDAPAPETPAQEIARLRTAFTELDGSYDPGSEVPPPRRHVTVPELHVDEDPEEPPIPLGMEAWQKNTEWIKAMLAKSSVQNAAPPPSPASCEATRGKAEVHVQELERIVSMSCALAEEACQRSKADKVASPTKEASPSQDASAPGDGSHSTLV